jgi:uncharacterized protein YprB with RNaseH-like and TPR domain
LLERTFLHIPGIGPKTEKKLWGRGIRTWRDFLLRPGPVFSRAKDDHIHGNLLASLAHRDNALFFADRLPSGERWRLYDAFKERAVFLDIETGGLECDFDEITVIGLYDGKNVMTFVNGVNLDEFEEALAPFQLVITFNGTAFDLPFIRRRFWRMKSSFAHIDLRFVLARLGIRGGLKNIEKQLGILRDSKIAGMNGWDAVRLWNAHLHGDRTALDLLTAYNAADVVNLKPLMEMAAGKLSAALEEWTAS